MITTPRASENAGMMLSPALWLRGVGQKATEIADDCRLLDISYKTCVHMDIRAAIHLAFWAKVPLWETQNLPRWACMVVECCWRFAGKFEEIFSGVVAGDRKHLMGFMGERGGTGCPWCHCWCLEQQMKGSASLRLPPAKGQVRQSGDEKIYHLLCCSFPSSP